MARVNFSLFLSLASLHPPAPPPSLSRPQVPLCPSMPLNTRLPPLSLTPSSRITISLPFSSPRTLLPSLPLIVHLPSSCLTSFHPLIPRTSPLSSLAPHSNIISFYASERSRLSISLPFLASSPHIISFYAAERLSSFLLPPSLPSPLPLPSLQSPFSFSFKHVCVSQPLSHTILGHLIFLYK